MLHVVYWSYGVGCRSSGELRRRLINSVQSAQRHIYPCTAPTPLHGCFPTPSYRYVAVSPSLMALYTELLQRRRALGTPLAGRPQPSVVVPSTLIPTAAMSLLPCLSSRHLPVVPTASDDAKDSEVSSTFMAKASPAVNDSSATLRKSLSADTIRYHPYEKTAWLPGSN